MRYHYVLREGEEYVIDLIKEVERGKEEYTRHNKEGTERERRKCI